MVSVNNNRNYIKPYISPKTLSITAIGAVPSPFDCFLVNRSVKTLSLRMETHQKNASAIANFLECHRHVHKVLYLGLPSHPQHSIVLKQCTGFSGMIAAYLHGTLQSTLVFLKNLKIFTLGESLGAVESLIELPSIMTHAMMTQEEREYIGITDTLVRISVGVENVQDLIGDLDQALNIAHGQQNVVA